ncbi:hypothetical protein ACFE04_010377 [Oxalis oulophora]
MDHLPKCEANYVPLTPLTFLKRAAAFYADRTSIIYEGTRFTWLQTHERCSRLASSLRSLNIVKNDVVSVLAPNIPALYEMHFAVPMAGAVLNAVNTRMDAKNIATILRHSEAKAFLVDCQFVPIAREALRILMGESKSSLPLVIVIDDIDKPTGVRLGELEYEQLVKAGNPRFVPDDITDEWDPIALNYTSGTTSDPKGVVYSHRGAYLNTLSLILGWEMGTAPVYLWSLPMFHCNGWTFTWGICARGGTNICMRNTTALDIFQNITDYKVTHMCCAPIVFNIILDAKPHERRQITSPVNILTGGAPPPASLLQRIEPIGENVSSVEVESVLFKHPNISDAAVVAMPHPRWGESPCAFVVLRKNLNRQEVKEEHIIAFCRKNLSHFMVPKKVEIVDQLPKNGNNKTLKEKLRNSAKSFVVSEEQNNRTNKRTTTTTNTNVSPENGPYDVPQQILALSRL